MSKKSKKVLKDARKLIEENGWGRNRMHNPTTGAFCAVGAILKAGDKSRDYLTFPITASSKPVFKAFDRLAAAIDESAPTVRGTVLRYWRAAVPAESQDIVMSWNDGFVASRTEVLAAFDRAING